MTQSRSILVTYHNPPTAEKETSSLLPDVGEPTSNGVTGRPFSGKSPTFSRRSIPYSTVDLSFPLLSTNSSRPVADSLPGRAITHLGRDTTFDPLPTSRKVTST